MTTTWGDDKAIIKLAKNDQAALEKKVKKFLKNLFKTSTTTTDETEDAADEEHNENYSSEEVLAKLTDFYECIEKIGKKKDCKAFIAFTLELFLGHSRVRQLLLEAREKNRPVRRKLILLFCLLCNSQLDVCKDQDSLIDLILGTYDASFSIEDQSLLNLLSRLESSGISLQKYQPFFWGVNGAVFYASKHAQKLAFLKMPTIEEVFTGFEGKRLANALSSFPIHVTLSSPIVEVIPIEQLNFPTATYDPRFLLSMFYHFLSGHAIIMCHKFIDYGALSYTIAALSSFCPRIRELAYQVLHRLHHHLECANYPQDRQLWTGLIEHIRSGLTEANQRIESVHTVFLVRAIEVLLKPLSPLFSSVRQFIISRQLRPYNYRSLPMFYRICLHLVSTSNMQTYAAFHKFALSWINDGLRSAADVRLCHRKGVFSDLLLLYNSPLCAAENRTLIMQVLTTLAQLPEGVQVLCFDCAIFAWLKHQLMSVPAIDVSQSTKKSLLYSLVSTLWETVYRVHLKKEEAAMASSGDSGEESPVATERYIFYRAFGYELIDVLGRIVYKSTEKRRIDRYVEVCDTVLQNTSNELTCFQIKQNICYNLPAQLETMLSTSNGGK